MKSSAADLIVTEPEHSSPDLVKIIASDHNYAVQDMNILKRKYDEIKESNERMRQELQNAKKREKRCKETLKDMLAKVKEAQRLSEEADNMLEAYKGKVYI